MISAPSPQSFGRAGIGATLTRTGPPLLLRATAVALFLFPANMIIKPLGAIGYVAMIMALLVFMFWLLSACFGLHKTIDVRHPGRVALTLILLASCATYVAMYMGISGASTVSGRASADRWMLLMAASTGIVLTVAETVQRIGDAMVMVRALLRGAFFCSLVAVVQFVTHLNPMDWIQSVMVGFVNNGGIQPFQERGSFLRVAGSTFHPIELGILASMLLPLSIWRGLYDRTGKKWLHWTGTGLLIFALAATVSRSGMIGIVVAVAIFVPFLPAVARKWAIVAVPFALATLFLAVPGLIATLFSTATAGTTDTSITSRLQDYPMVEAMTQARPLTGIGPGAYLTSNALDILDNQYLKTLVEMGIPGFISLVLYMLIPGVAAWIAARNTHSPQLRTIAAAVSAGCLIATPAAATFDALGFPVFALVYPFFVGLSGSVWIMVKKELQSPKLGSADHTSTIVNL